MKQVLFKESIVLIVDDNPGFLRLLHILLDGIGFGKIIEAKTAEEGLKIFQEQQIDLCILDIDLGDNIYNGIDLAEKIRVRDLKIPIIFLTSNFTEAYYKQCRHTRPSSFMNKELSRFKLIQAIDIAFLQQDKHTIEKDKSERNEKPAIPFVTDSIFFFKIGDSFKSFELKDISFFFSKEKLTYAKVGKRNYPASVHLKTLAEELHPNFLRIHKSYLVNRERIEMIHTKEGKVHIGEELLPIGYAYRKEFFNNLRMFK